MKISKKLSGLLIILVLSVSIGSAWGYKVSQSHTQNAAPSSPVIPSLKIVQYPYHAPGGTCGGATNCTIIPNTLLCKAPATNYKGTVRLNVTWSTPSTTLNSTYTIYMVSFWLVILPAPGDLIIVSNSTNISYQNPTNTIASIQLFPNITITFILSFNNVCVPPSAQIRMVYLDGTYSFQSNIP